MDKHKDATKVQDNGLLTCSCGYDTYRVADFKKHLSPVTPEVGMGVTVSVGSDRYPATITRIVSVQRIEIQYDSYRRTDGGGLSESQDYIFALNPNASKKTVSLRRDGNWRFVGEDGGRTVFLGGRSAYQDPSF